MKKNLTQREKIALWQKKVENFTAPNELNSLLFGIQEPEKLLGIDRVTLARWRSGESRIPLTATRFLEILRGELPKWFGIWEGWRFSPDGWLFPPGWGEGLSREDILNLWTWRRQAFMVQAMECENARLKKDLAFYKSELQTKQRLGFAESLGEVLQEVTDCAN
ncbi:MAG: hypothetical protein LLG15_01485 [Betaproteobacteria bacterium]|nr:hypothetical protein [Betaproteobacteria bacterium]